VRSRIWASSLRCARPATGPYVIAAYGASEATVKQAAQQSGSGANLYIVSRFAPVTDNVPGTKAIKDAAAKYGLADPNSMHVTGWVLAHSPRRR
jgi:hypothetical protein